MHSKQCLAAAIIAAVENLRDAADSSFDFRIAAQEDAFIIEADGYLSDGTMTCTCGEYEVEQLFDSFQRHSHDPELLDHVQESASQALRDGTISPTQYMGLARRCHNFTAAERIRRDAPDSKPLPENVEGHAMWGPTSHGDGRACYYHQRLGMWTFNNTEQCLRSGHPTLAELTRRKS